MRPFWEVRLPELRELAKTQGSHQIAENFGRSVQAVQKVCSRNGISIFRPETLPGGKEFVNPNKGKKMNVAVVDPFGRAPN